MRNMSFFHTQSQMRARTKDVTRRLGWHDLKPGDVVMAIEKGQGLKRGEKVTRIYPIECVSNRKEALDALRQDVKYGEDEIRREGFEGMSVPAFIDFFCKNIGCTPTTPLNRIEFRPMEELSATVNENSIAVENWQTPMALDEGIIQLKRHIAEGMQALGRVQEGTKAFCIALWKQGGVVANLLDQARYGDSVMAQLEQATGYKASALYDRRNVFDYYETEADLEIAMDERIEGNGSVSWNELVGHVRKSLKTSSNGSATQDADQKLEDRKRALEKRAEKLEQAAEALQREVVELGEDEEIIGAITKAQQVAEETRVQTGSLELPKPERVTNEQFLAYVRQYDCLVCQAPGQRVEAHHLDKAGMGTKGPDYYTVPLCSDHHQECETHPQGQTAFWVGYNIYPWRTVAQLIARFFDARMR